MPRPSSPQERQRARDEARSTASKQAATSAQRRKRWLAVIALLVVLAMVGGLIGALIAGGDSTTSSATSTSSTASTTSSAPPVVISAIDPGATLTEPTPCPAEDGSSPRTTSFAGAPPTCIDPAFTYKAVIHTTVGDLAFQLNPLQAPNAVNNFVVLSRYHYYDGQPFAPILPKELVGIEAKFNNPEGATSPGYQLPSEVPPQGQLYGPGTIAFLPIDASGAYDAPFLIASFGPTLNVNVDPTAFGIMLDGTAALQAIDRAGSASGDPTQDIRITSIDVTQSVPVN